MAESNDHRNQISSSITPDDERTTNQRSQPPTNERTQNINRNKTPYKSNKQYSQTSWKQAPSMNENQPNVHNVSKHHYNKVYNSNLNSNYSNKNRVQNESKRDKIENSTLTNNEKQELNKISTQKSDMNEKKIRETRSETLIDQLVNNKYECLVCCSVIKEKSAIWTCGICYHIFHIYCIKKWSQASINNEQQSQTWRCPCCQHFYDKIPNKYYCFCGKNLNPDCNKQYTPHSCGEVCGKLKANVNINPHCTHKCVQLCHPGPCMPCEALVTRQCGCGKVKFQVKCNSNKIPLCDNICGKELNCKKHFCRMKCHNGKCETCDIDNEQKCYSHNHSRIIKCDNLNTKYYSCDMKCNRLLNCKLHSCQKQCHPGRCNDCELMPNVLNLCPCGKTSINTLLNETNKRKLCTDPIPTCDKLCEKVLDCSVQDDLHLCLSKCHNNVCLPCTKFVQISCRCGSLIETVKCYEKTQKLCKKRCNKKKSCGRHKCTNECCNNVEHLCTLICNRDLNCGLHKCDQLCHKGNCSKCLIASFDEISCRCGKTILYPPIRCGAKLPECTYPCHRIHECSHPVQHNCHNEEKCPPCNYLTSKICMGEHETRNNIPCYMKDVSCGRPCGKLLPCGQHKCIKICHKGECLNENEKCTQPCNNERPHCTHPCMAECHFGLQCPDTICQAVINAKCNCGRKFEQIKCMQRTYDTQTVVFENLASEIKEMLTNNKTIDLNTFQSNAVLKKKYEILCDEECFIIERNKQLAQALQIDNTKTIAKPLYSDFLKLFARDNINFVLFVEKNFFQLIKETNSITNKYKKKFIKFDVNMKSIERKLIYELASFYKLETQSSGDKDINRSIKVYATKDQCSLPSILLSNCVEIKTKQTNLMGIQSNYKKNNQIKANNNNTSVFEHEFYPIELKISPFTLIENLSDGDDNYDDQLFNENERVNYINSTKVVKPSSNQTKEIDYFDYTD